MKVNLIKEYPRTSVVSLSMVTGAILALCLKFFGAAFVLCFGICGVAAVIAICIKNDREMNKNV